MKFHDYRSVYMDRIAYMPESKKYTPIEFYDYLFSVNDVKRSQIGGVWIAAETCWYTFGCPYYKVWPGVLDVMGRMKLDRPAPDYRLTNRFAVVLRFPTGREPECGCGRVESMLAAIMDVAYYDEYGARLPTRPQLSVVYKLSGSTLPNLFSLNLSVPDQSVDDVLHGSATVGTGRDDGTNQIKFLTRVAISLSMMMSDSNFVRPDSAPDAALFDGDRSPEGRVERAEARGVRGWKVGKELEGIPHIRRPHFGVRWTGPGATVPRIVPVRGSLVKREKLVRVPTGHILQDGEEIEPDLG